MAGVYGSNLGFNVDQYGIRLGADRAGQANNYLQSPAQTPGAAPPGQGSTLYQPAGGSYKPPGGR